MKTIFISILFFSLFGGQIHAQNNEQIIESIRKRYYRINSGNIKLLTFQYQDSEYFIDGAKISIIKHQTDEGRFEYYFDTKSNEYYPYFIYFSSKDTNVKPDIRAYYDYRSELILLKQNEEIISINPFNHDFFYLLLDAYNKLNTLLNLFEMSTHQNDLKTDVNIQKVDFLKKSITRADTINKIENDGEYQLEVAFKNSKGNIIKRTKFYSAEHNGSSEHIYYTNSQPIMKIDEEETWVGSMSSASIIISYFEDGKIYRTDIYKSYGKHPGFNENLNDDLEFSTDNMIPRITYYTSVK